MLISTAIILHDLPLCPRLALQRPKKSQKIGYLRLVQLKLGHIGMARRDPFGKCFSKLRDWITPMDIPKDWSRSNRAGACTPDGMASRTSRCSESLTTLRLRCLRERVTRAAE